MEDKIFKEKQIKKTLIESVHDPLTGDIIGAVRINNENKIDKIIDIDASQNPILDEGTQNLLKQEANFNGEVLDPVESHREAVKRNHTAQLPNEIKPQDPKARPELTKPSEAPKMFAEKMTEDRVEDIAEQVAERVIDEQMLNVEVTENRGTNNNEDKS